MNIKQILKKTSIYDKYLLIKYKKNEGLSYDRKEKIINKMYKKVFNEDINWSNPKTYNEKMNVSKLYGDNIMKTKLTDKYEVRKWIREKIGDEYLIPIIGVYNSFEEIDFNKLPNKFVIKMNNDSGSVFICQDKNKINIKKLRKKFNFFIKRNYAYASFEMHYKDIEPKIIIEKYMGNSINDYKFQCFDGKVYYCRVDFDRFGNHMRNFYDLNWNLQLFNKGDFNNNVNKIDKPKNFDKMVEIVQKLSQGFDQVRVDLYDINGEIYFGEMTFTNGAGLEKINPKEWDYKIGELWKYDIKLREIKNK